MTKTAKAVLFQYTRGEHAALAQHATIAIAHVSDLVGVPGAPYFCQNLLKWQGGLIPAIDLRALVNAAPVSVSWKEPNVLVVAYQKKIYQALEYGALLIESLPAIVDVTNDMASELSKQSDYWPMIADSCFLHSGEAVPILNTQRLFSRGHK